MITQHDMIVGLVSCGLTLALVLGLFAAVGYLAFRDFPKDLT